MFLHRLVGFPDDKRHAKGTRVLEYGLDERGRVATDLPLLSTQTERVSLGRRDVLSSMFLYSPVVNDYYELLERGIVSSRDIAAEISLSSCDLPQLCVQTDRDRIR